MSLSWKSLKTAMWKLVGREFRTYVRTFPISAEPADLTPHAQEFVMPEPSADLDRPEPDRPAAPRRVVPDWEYRTAYIETFQVRIPAGLHNRLCEWARQERKPPGDLVIEILEEAVRRRGGWRG